MQAGPRLMAVACQASGVADARRHSPSCGCPSVSASTSPAQRDAAQPPCPCSAHPQLSAAQRCGHGVRSERAAAVELQGAQRALAVRETVDRELHARRRQARCIDIDIGRQRLCARPARQESASALPSTCARTAGASRLPPSAPSAVKCPAHDGNSTASCGACTAKRPLERAPSSTSASSLLAPSCMRSLRSALTPSLSEIRRAR